MDRFHVRNASSAEDDAQFIIAAWDSTLPYLASIGAGEMWGDQPFSQREGSLQELVDIIRSSEEHDESESRRLLVAEVKTLTDGSGSSVQAGAAMIRDALPTYLLERPELKSEIEKGHSLLYIEVLISDRRAQHRSRGAGAALIEAIKGRALEEGKSAMYVDAWAGNDRKLNKYYENLGFKNAGDFALTRRNGSTWPGTLYYIDLAASATTAN